MTLANLIVLADTVDLKDPLCGINTDCGKLGHGRLLYLG
jgi:hypothetical protein